MERGERIEAGDLVADGARLERGDLPPRMVTRPPGPRARELCRDLERLEAPGINTLPAGGATILWQEALGANVLDVDGNLYVDLTGGFGAAAVGHRNPAVLAAVGRQAERLVHGLGDVHAHPARVDLARRLAARAPVDDPRIYFAVSGADAVEVALKTALRATGRPGVVAFDPAYHGLTLGALAVSSRDAFRRPFREHLHPHLRRLPFACPPGDLDRALADGSGRIGALILEPIVGREGVLVPPAGWLPAVAELCARHRVVLIADEVLTGFGRTGSWFAVDAEGVRPDLLCCGKALGGGLPIAAVVGRGELMAAWSTDGEALHTATFTAHPLACAAALATLDLLEGQDLPARARRLGGRVGSRLAELRDAPAVVEVRGRGLLQGIEVADAGRARRWAAAALERGVLLLAGGPGARVLELTPPLTIAEAQLDHALDLLVAALPAG